VLGIYHKVLSVGKAGALVSDVYDWKLIYVDILYRSTDVM